MSSSSESRSERFRRRVFETYEPESLSPADLEYIEEVVYTMDFLDRLRDSLADADLTEVRTGGLRMRPEVVEARLQATHLANLLKRFPALEEDE